MEHGPGWIVLSWNTVNEYEFQRLLARQQFRFTPCGLESRQTPQRISSGLKEAPAAAPPDCGRKGRSDLATAASRVALFRDLGTISASDPLH